MMNVCLKQRQGKDIRAFGLYFMAGKCPAIFSAGVSAVSFMVMTLKK
jgi:hypothetical protein